MSPEKRRCVCCLYREPVAARFHCQQCLDDPHQLITEECKHGFGSPQEAHAHDRLARVRECLERHGVVVIATDAAEPPTRFHLEVKF